MKPTGRGIQQKICTFHIYSYHVLVDLLDDHNNDTYCVRSGANHSEAKSPAFEIPGKFNIPFRDPYFFSKMHFVSDYDFTKGEYSTWMESRWLKVQVRIFLITDPAWEGAVLAVGLLVVLLSLVIVYLVATGSDILFAPSAEVNAL